MRHVIRPNRFQQLIFVEHVSNAPFKISSCTSNL